MKKFSVVVKEVWEQTWEVEASSVEEAYNLACNGEGKEGGFEYGHTLDPDIDNDVKEIHVD